MCESGEKTQRQKGGQQHTLCSVICTLNQRALWQIPFSLTVSGVRLEIHNT